MDDLIPITMFNSDDMEIMPSREPSGFHKKLLPCSCCGRPAAMDEDCCGICEECLLS